MGMPFSALDASSWSQGQWRRSTGSPGKREKENEREKEEGEGILGELKEEEGFSPSLQFKSLLLLHLLLDNRDQVIRLLLLLLNCAKSGPNSSSSGQCNKRSRPFNVLVDHLHQNNSNQSGDVLLFLFHFVALARQIRRWRRSRTTSHNTQSVRWSW